MFETEKIKLIVYMCPGHQASEFPPWLINHSSDCGHGCMFMDKWTHYESDFGIGKEPIESHWILPDDQSTIYKDCRMNGSFTTEFLDTAMNNWRTGGTFCLFFNHHPHEYNAFVNDFRKWKEMYDNVELLFIGHTFDIFTAKNPSRYFIKEGYIINQQNSGRDTFFNSLHIHHKGQDQSWQNYFSKIHEVRYTELINIYKECNFDHVWTFDDIVEKESCKALISSVVTLPNDFDKLFDKYMFLNPPDVQLDKRIHELISST